MCQMQKRLVIIFIYLTVFSTKIYNKRYCDAACQKENHKYHQPNCNDQAYPVGLPIFITVPKVTSEQDLTETILNVTKYTIAHSWYEDSNDQNKFQPFSIEPSDQVLFLYNTICHYIMCFSLEKSEKGIGH